MTGKTRWRSYCQLHTPGVKYREMDRKNRSQKNVRFRPKADTTKPHINRLVRTKAISPQYRPQLICLLHGFTFGVAVCLWARQLSSESATILVNKGP